MTINTLILPIYLIAEKKQKAMREKQKQMKGKIDKIRAVFKGDERYMLTSTFYRQNNYHPIYALSNSLDLFIQIPFFIAAYHFLHNLELLNGQKFKFIADLGAPDGLLWGINLLPIIMTAINCFSGAIYAKELQFKEKIQLYGIALVFFVLLYNSPSALVLYWTCNNIYNLIKNIILKNGNLKKYVYPAIVFIIYLFMVYILLSTYEIGKIRRYMLTFNEISINRWLMFTFLTWILIMLLYRKQIIKYINEKIIVKKITYENTRGTFILSIIGIFLLVGLVIPSSLIASSVEEFSYLEQYSSPLLFIGMTLLQSVGILIWFVCIYFLFTKRGRRIMTLVLSVVLGIFIVNAFCFNPYYGFMTPDLNLSYFHSVPVVDKIINILFLLFTIVAIIFLLLIKKGRILFALQSILVISLLCYGIMNIFKINNNFTNLNRKEDSIPNKYGDFNKIYTFSRGGKNLLIIMLDMGISGYVPYIFNEKPELLNSFRGFTYYPNTISFGQATVHGLSGIFGGYDYTPLNRPKKGKTYNDKLYESLQVLPRILAESGFNVFLYNTFFIDYSLLNTYKNIVAGSVPSTYFMQYYLDNINPISIKKIYQILYNNLIRFSFLKSFPIIFHTLIYDNGKFLSLFEQNKYKDTTIESYASLYFLPNITEITDDFNNYANIFSNDMAHEPGFMQVPEYIPSDNITNKGNGPYSQEIYFHGNMASFVLFAKYFDFLKENGVYDNTRIIIVSDHGVISVKPFPNSISFPDIDYWSLEASNCILLVKDFNSEFELKTDNKFMTNADVPHIATEGLVQLLINPFNGKKMFIEKEDGVTITISPQENLDKLINEGIKSNDWLYVKDNIFDPTNWSKVNIDDN